MLDLVVVVLLFYFLGEPLLVALHELGHALVPLAAARETEVFVGGEVGRRVSVGGLTLTVAPIGFLSPVTYGATASDADLGRWSVVASVLAGPLVSLFALVAVGSVLVRGVAPPLGWFVLLLAAYLWFQTLFTLVPLRYRGSPADEGAYRSDGWVALELALGRDRRLDSE